MAPVDAIAILHRLAPTRSQALLNLDALTRFLEECTRNISCCEEEEEDLNDVFPWGASAAPMSVPPLRGRADAPHTWPRSGQHGGDAAHASSSGFDDGREASGRGDQWIACVRHIFFVCMPHVEAAQVRLRLAQVGSRLPHTRLPHTRPGRVAPSTHPHR
jgi:hypothetical protein